jgi:hypothetical protein
MIMGWANQPDGGPGWNARALAATAADDDKDVPRANVGADGVGAPPLPIAVVAERPNDGGVNVPVAGDAAVLPGPVGVRVVGVVDAITTHTFG